MFVQSRLRNTSRTRARAIVEKNAYSTDARALRASDRVHAEDLIVLWREPWERDVADVEMPVLYEDEHLLAIDKPPLVTVHPTARYDESTVLRRLQKARPGQFVALVHRIDRETSGILLIAKSKESDRAFKQMFEDRSVAESGHRPVRPTPPKIAKVYLAITWGTPTTGLVDRAIEVDSDNPLRVKMRIAEGGGLEARTHLEVLETRGGYALVRCELFTGRQHQIRVHLAALGCPVVGDKLYGPDDRMLARAADDELTEQDLLRLELPRQALHAHRYSLTHAMTQLPLTIESPLPTDLDEFWQSRPRDRVEP